MFRQAKVAFKVCGADLGSEFKPNLESGQVVSYDALLPDVLSCFGGVWELVTILFSFLLGLGFQNSLKPLKLLLKGQDNNLSPRSQCHVTFK